MLKIVVQKYDICYYLINIFDRIMKYNNPVSQQISCVFLTKLSVAFFLFFTFQNSVSQTNQPPLNSTIVKPASNNGFVEDLRFGGNIGLIFSSEFSDILVAPIVLYEFNDYVSAGVGMHFNYLRERNRFETFVYGASLIGIANPIEFLQLSAELEQLRFNVSSQVYGNENFWNTALFLGVGLRQENFTVGFRYNVLHLNKNGYYSEPLIPFIRFTF